MSSNNNAGSIRVDFAGTFVEARKYAKENGVNVSSMLARAGGEGLPMLSLPFKDEASVAAARAKFEELGWDLDSQLTVLRESKKRSHAHLLRK